MLKRIHPTVVALIVMAPCLLAGCSGSGSAKASAPGKSTAPTENSGVESPTPSQADPGELLTNGLMPFDDILVGGQPTREQFATMKDLGYKTVINVRMLGESGSTNPDDVEQLGMAYIAMPLNGNTSVSEESARHLAKTLESVEHPVLVHCASGNRVGALFGMKAFIVDGLSPEESLAVAREAGITRLESALKEKLGL